jgi:hypothetical protein
VTGISRTTIAGWRRNGRPGRKRRSSAPCPICDGTPLDQPAYAYLLGLYLGDGWLSRGPRAYRLRIVQDARYPYLIGLAKETMTRVRAGYGKVGTAKKTGCVEICGYWKHWPCLFPQHGPGRKHLRAIVLTPWQTEIVDAYPSSTASWPDPLGRLPNDQPRAKGRYAYPRYFFTNNSEDILWIFREACDAIGVRHRTSRPNTISIAKRADVAALDTFIGPKQ